MKDYIYRSSSSLFYGSCAQTAHEAQINFRDLTPYLTYDIKYSLFDSFRAPLAHVRSSTVQRFLSPGIWVVLPLANIWI